MDDASNQSPALALREALVSPAFLVGAAMLVVWGVAVVGVHDPGLVAPLDPLADPYRMLVGVLPGAYVVAGLLAPRRPFLTGFLLAVVHLGVGALTDLLTVTPESEPVPGMAWLVVLVALVVLLVGTMVTGLVGRFASRLWGR